MQLAATVLDESAEPLASAGRPAKFALLFGGEPQGLGPEYVAACDRRLTIPMKMGTDSLNVAVAAGIFLYHFTRPLTRRIAHEGHEGTREKDEEKKRTENARRH